MLKFCIIVPTLNAIVNMQNPLVKSDVEEILDKTKLLWEELKEKKIFLTGGTGFFGMWILESFAAANEKFNLNSEMTVLTRNEEDFKQKFPHLGSNRAINFCKGDIKNFSFPTGSFDYVIHMAATPAKATFNNADYLDKFDTIANGTRHILDFAAQANVKKFLFTSSAVVYGKQPQDMTHIPEDYNGAPDPTDLANYSANLGISKRTAEFFCAYYANKFNIETKIARCFSFVGPGLPLDVHYAIGNFIGDGLNNRPIQIKGDGTPRRSYLYSTDLAIWLWTILFKGASGRIYNVGSEKDLSIGELAHKVAEGFENKITVNIAKLPTPGAPAERQVPSTKRAQNELGLKESISLTEAIIRTIQFHRNQI